MSPNLGGSGPYDLIVIGGGSTGCVIAARASEDPGRRVLLVEAGFDPQPVPDLIADPRRQPELIRDEAFVRHYSVERRDGSTFQLVSGRVIGGGSAVNSLSVQRPTRGDFDAWQEFGGPGWSYEALLPLMRAIEDDPDFGDQPIHGRGGPLRLRRRWKLDDPADPPVGALLEAATDLGFSTCPDLNVPEPFGICATPYNLVGGRRQTVADAYLLPARGRPNLTILPETTAAHLVLDGARVRGVELVTPEGPAIAEANQIVISAGAYQSPHLLMLSGIGPAGALESVGVEVLHRLDGIGENFQDHAVVYLAFAGGPDLEADHIIPKIRLMAKSDPDLDHPDLHVLMRPSIREADGRLRLPVSIHLLEHRSRGRIWLRSADPLALPCVDAALLQDPGDVRAIVGGIAFATRLVEHPKLARFYGPPVRPAPGADWAEHAVSSFVSYNHALGTCRMGPASDPLAVVGPDLRLHGIDNLWVADTSVLPVIPHAATNLAAILVGEVAAREIARAG